MELEKLQEVIANVLSVDPNEITLETTFLEDLGADSLDVYQIIMGIEEVFILRYLPRKWNVSPPLERRLN